MAYKNADKLSKKLRLLEEQKHGMVKQTNNVSTVITRGSANRDNRSKTTTAATKTYTAPKATTASSYKTGGTTTKYTATPKVAASVPKAPAVSTPAPKFTAPTVLTSSAKQEPKPTQKYDFEGYLSALSALETARAQAVQAQNTYLNTQGLIEKGKEFFQNSGNLAAAQADVQRIAAKNSASAITNLAKKAANNGAALQSAQANANRTAANTAASAAAKYGKNIWDSYSNNANAYSQSLARQGKTYREYALQAATGYKQWKSDREKKKQQLNDPNYQRYAEHVFKNNYAGSVEGVASLPYVMGADNSAYEPRPFWTDEERNEFGFRYGRNPQEAADYAREVNDSYKKKKEEKTVEWAENHQALALGGAFVMDRLSLAEAQNNELAYARDKNLPYTTEVTPLRYSKLVRDAIRDDMNREERGSGDAYAAIDDAVNTAYFGYLQKYGGDLFGTVASGVEKYSGDFNEALYRAKELGLSGEEAINYARKTGLSGAFGDGLSNLLSNHLGGTGVTESMLKEGVGNTVGGVIENVADYEIERLFLGDNSEFNGLVTAYITAGKSQEEAEDMAWNLLRKKLLKDTIKDISSGLIYGLGVSDHSVKRSLFK